MLGGKNVAQTQSYGIAQRGGFISSEVVVDDGEILFQQVTKPDLIIVLSEIVGTRYDAVFTPVLYDSSLLTKMGFTNWIGIPFAQIARDIGSPHSANMVAIGAMVEFLPFVDVTVFEKAAVKRNAATAEASLKAIMAGITAVKQFTTKG